MYAKQKRLNFWELMQVVRFVLITTALLMAMVITPIAIKASASYTPALEGTVDRAVEAVKVRSYRVRRTNPRVYEENVSDTEGTANAQKTTAPEEIINPVNWSTMYVGVDVAAMFAEPEGEKLGEINFADEVKVSTEECKEGWAKVEHAEVEGFVKTENLLTAEEMLENNQYLFAQILYAEAGGVSKAEMGLVGEVVLNRLTTDYWEFEPYCTTILGVVKQSGQYPETYRKIQNGLVPSEDAMEVAKAMLLGEYKRLLPEECLWQTGFYPRWNVEVVVYPGNWELDDGTVINVYHHYSVLKG